MCYNSVKELISLILNEHIVDQDERATILEAHSKLKEVDNISYRVLNSGKRKNKDEGASILTNTDGESLPGIRNYHIFSRCLVLGIQRSYIQTVILKFKKHHSPNDLNKLYTSESQ